MTDQASVQLEVEAACQALQDPTRHEEADRALRAFRNGPNVMPSSLHILRHSCSYDARFQAALALRESAMASWLLMSPAEQTTLRLFVLDYTAQLASAPAQEAVHHSLVRTLTALHALLLKRQWTTLAEGERQAAGQALCSRAATPGGDAALALQLLVALVREVHPVTASSLALPWSFHEQCRSSFAGTLLQQVFQTAVTAAAMQPVAPPSPVLAEATTLMTVILTWDLNRSAGFVLSASSFGFGQSGTSSASMPSVKHLSPSWLALVLSPTLLQWALRALQSVGRQSGSGDQFVLALRTLLVQLCCLSGKSLREDEAAHRAWAHFCVHGIMAVLDPAAQLAEAAESQGAEDALLDISRACHSLCHSARLAGLLDALGVTNLDHFLSAMTQLSFECIGRGGLSVDNATEWKGQATSQLLEAWTALLNTQRSEIAAGRLAPAGVSALEQAAALVFEALVAGYARELDLAAHIDACEATEQAEDAWEGDALERAAALARAALPHAVPALKSVLTPLLAPLFAGCAVTEGALEQLCWFLQLASSVLADDGVNETPLVPVEMLELCEQAAPQVQDAVDLGQLLCQVAALPADASKQAVLSPRFLEAALSAFARWLDTYVAPEEALPTACAMLSPPAEAVLLVAIEATAACLTRYPNETALHTVAVDQLLHAVVSRPARCVIVSSLPVWPQLRNAVCASGPGAPFRSVHSSLQRTLVCTVCSAAVRAQPFARSERGASLSGAVADTVQQNESLLHELLSPSLELLASFASTGGDAKAAHVANVAGRADVVEDLVVALERLRGAVQGMRHYSSCVIYTVLAPSLPALTAVQRLYAHHALITALLFRLACALVDALLGVIDTEKAQELANWCLGVLQAYSSWQQSEAGGAAGGSNASCDAEGDRAEQLEALLELLASLTQSFDTDASSRLAEVVFQGLHAILSVLTQPLLRYPPVARTYYALLLQLSELYPSNVARLPPSHFAPLVQSLDWGLAQAAADVTTPCLQALEELGSFHHRERAAGRTGLAHTALPGGDAPVAHFMQSILQHTLQHSNAEGTIGRASAALLPLVASEPACFFKSAEALAGITMPQDTRKSFLMAGHAIVSVATERGPLTFATKSAFETKFYAFMESARGFLHRK